ncbi:MAG: Acyl carrier protein, partial [uncultured Acidimicrobiales bacterium]
GSRRGIRHLPQGRRRGAPGRRGEGHPPGQLRRRPRRRQPRPRRVRDEARGGLRRGHRRERARGRHQGRAGVHPPDVEAEL